MVAHTGELHHSRDLDPLDSGTVEKYHIYCSDVKCFEQVKCVKVYVSRIRDRAGGVACIS